LPFIVGAPSQFLEGSTTLNLTGNTILITGGATGIGLALAKRLSQQGNQVIICGRSEAALQKAKQTCRRWWYRLVFGHDASNPDEFFGRYIEVTPYSRLAWTNDEGGDGGPVTTVTFEERGGKTLLIMHELYPSKEALDAAGTGAADGVPEQFEQLDELPVTLGASVGRS
jgi:hypothetical protein